MTHESFYNLSKMDAFKNKTKGGGVAIFERSYFVQMHYNCAKTCPYIATLSRQNIKDNKNLRNARQLLVLAHPSLSMVFYLSPSFELRGFAIFSRESKRWGVVCRLTGKILQKYKKVFPPPHRAKANFP